MTGLLLVTDDAHLGHDPAYELNAGQRVSPVPDRPERVHTIRDALVATGARLVGPRRYGDQVLDGVHDPDLVAFLADAHRRWRAAGGPEVMLADTFRSPAWAGGGRPPTSPLGALGWYCTDTATAMVAGSYAAARAAVDLACTAVDQVLDGQALAYALTRPPGHHAGPGYFGGFCLLNHAAVAARRLSSQGRVAVLDLDVHHGNGTQDVFYTDPQVLYVSLHTDPNHQYPYFSGYADEQGAGPGRGTTRNLPLPPGTGDERYLAALKEALEAVVTFRPAAVVVSLGLDAAAADPLGQLSLTAAGFAQAGAAVAGAVQALAVPAVVVQEGGYALEDLGSLAVAFLTGLAPTLHG